MSQIEKIMLSVLSGTKDSNIAFTDLQKLLILLGFTVRIKGDHFIYTKDGIEEIINIQPKENKAKPYQVKQVRNIILRAPLKTLFRKNRLCTPFSASTPLGVRKHACEGFP